MFRSLKFIVIPPARTGNLNNNNKTVITKHQINKLNLFKDSLTLRISCLVPIKFILLTKDLTPDICKAKKTKSVERPRCPSILKGGYKVQPVPLPISVLIEVIIKKIEKGKIQ
jgi:hypothetical protein